VDSDRDLRHLPLDLRDADACRAAASELRDVTHVVYAAVFEKPGLVQGWFERDQMDTNLAMLRNLMEPLRVAASGLRHVSLLQGTKAYGAHLHPIPVPARERLPRDPHENFYWLHEDHIREASAADGWTFTIWRPQLIVGPNHGVVMNLPPIIGAFAAIRREEGLPFGFPGGAVWVWEAVDTRLVADAMVWAASSPNAAGETFNLTNGEVFDWRTMWPSFAETLGVELGPDEPLSIAQYLPAKADVWDRVVDKYDLRRIPMADLVGESHHYADVCFAYGADTSPSPKFLSTVKLKQAGFCGTYDTEESFLHWFRVLIDRRILPPPPR
jgi:nucleoside-diphosphate-sugar epimerase